MPESDRNKAPRGGPFVPCPSRTTCFPGDTQVLTPNGYQRIDALNPGSRIMTFDEASGLLVESSVKKQLVHMATVWEIELSGAHGTLRVTPGHTLHLSSGAWTRVDKLKPGMRLTVVVGNEAEVVSITENSVVEKVYNLYPYGDKTFVVGSVVAHSFTHFRELRAICHEFLEALAARRTRRILAYST